MTLRIIYIMLASALFFTACKPKPGKAISSAAPSVADTSHIPKPVGFVNDFAQVFTPQQTGMLDSMVRDYERRTSIEIAIATFNADMMGAQPFEHYTQQVAKEWHIGKKEKNNGMLISIAPGLRRMYINTGTGIQKVLENNAVQNIIDSVFIPKFKNGDYYGGTREGLLAIMKKLNG